MSRKDRDPRAVAFEQAARRLGLSGKIREVAWHYFMRTPVKQIGPAVEMTEGTLKGKLNRLHGLLRTTNRPEFVHGIYGNGTRGRRLRRGHDGRSDPPPRRGRSYGASAGKPGGYLARERGGARPR